MSPAEGRTCTKTGLRLIPVDDSVSFHVGKRTYPQPSAPWRSADVHRQERGRFDTLGRTYYLAETAECAFAEVLASLRRTNGSEDPLAPIAAALDITLEETVAAIAEDWDEADFRGVGALPSTWYRLRRMYRARIVDGGWLVDIEHPDAEAARRCEHPRPFGGTEHGKMRWRRELSSGTPRAGGQADDQRAVYNNPAASYRTVLWAEDGAGQRQTA